MQTLVGFQNARTVRERHRPSEFGAVASDNVQPRVEEMTEMRLLTFNPRPLA